MFKVLDDRVAIATVADRWKAQYCHKGEWGGSRKGGEKRIYMKLKALPNNATREDVRKIIGNDSWVGTICTECGERAAIMQVGDDADYGSSTVWLCKSCIQSLSLIASVVYSE